MLTRRGFLFRKAETKSQENKAPEHKSESLGSSQDTAPCNAAVHDRLRLAMEASLVGKEATAEERAAMSRANACPFCGVKLSAD